MTEEPKPPDTSSPTGRPVVSKRLVPYLTIGAALSGAIVAGGELGLELGGPHVKGWAIVAGIFFATLLGTSPGWRK